MQERWATRFSRLGDVEKWGRSGKGLGAIGGPSKGAIANQVYRNIQEHKRSVGRFEEALLFGRGMVEQSQIALQSHSY